MRVCPICGERFDARRYQVLASGLDEAFDSVDCAARAQASTRLATSSTGHELLRDLTPGHRPDEGSRPA